MRNFLISVALGLGLTTLLSQLEFLGPEETRSFSQVASLRHKSHDHDEEEQTKTVLASRALDFVMSRQAAYHEAGMQISWKFRGVGYLYSRHDVILAATIILEEKQEQEQKKKKKKKSVHIYNVHPNASHRHTGQARDDCDKFTIWARVYGPEIFAGSAQAVEAQGSRDCYWKFDFEPSVPGEYAVDAKPLLWNSKRRDYELEQRCRSWKKENETTKGMMEKQYPKHSGFKGFKLYSAELSCCEFCNRLAPYCEMWANPAWKIDDPSPSNNGCEFFFGTDTPDEYIPKSWLLGDINVSIPQSKQNRQRRLMESVYDRPHGGEPQYFIGCGWTSWFTLDSPCLSGELDDKVFFLNDTFQLSFNNLVEQQLGRLENKVAELPLCIPEIEFMGNSSGRWVQEGWPNNNATCPPFRIDKNASVKYDIVTHDGENPHCWHRDDLSHVGDKCIEMNCRFINPISIWESRARVEKWFGVWREESCDYVEFTDDKLQQCIDIKKIKRFGTDGKSISVALQQYLSQRVSGLQLYTMMDDPDAIEVVLSTASLLHHTQQTDTQVRDFLKNHLVTPDRNRRVFVVSGFYLSSEREVFTHVERMVQLNRVIEDVLPPIGYELLNVFDLSAAFTYDTAAQRDGMHIIGPPMKMAITKMFHYLCYDVVSGSRV